MTCGGRVQGRTRCTRCGRTMSQWDHLHAVARIWEGYSIFVLVLVGIPIGLLLIGLVLSVFR